VKHLEEPLDLERFRSLAESYGANINRWPAKSQASARVTALGAEAAVILREQAALDAALDEWRPPVVSRDFPQQLVTTATAAGRGCWATARYWWAGIGLAAALSGAAAGTVGTAFFVMPQQMYGDTIFGDLPDVEDD
jgi:hypothetical protein